jgi:hypothetical protein
MTARAARTVFGVLTWPVAAVSLVAGFAVADVTGVRPLGGLVLAAALLWCGLRWRATVGLGRAVALAGFYLAGFAVSHRLADTLGAWGSVTAVAVSVGLVTWLVADLDRPSSGAFRS